MSAPKDSLDFWLLKCKNQIVNSQVRAKNDFKILTLDDEHLVLKLMLQEGNTC